MRTPVLTARHPIAFSVALRRELDDLRDDFLPFVAACQVLTTKRRDIAPAFMKLFHRYKRETHGTFVAFVHELDPTMPVDRDHYPNHRSYQTALYLRRIVEAPHTTMANRRTAAPFAVAAMLLRSLLVLSKGKEPEIWSALKRQSHWDDRQIDRLKLKMAKVHPIAIPGAPRLVKRPLARAS